MLQGPEKKSRHSKEQLHCRVARSRQAKTDTQKNNCTTLLPSPGTQSWTCKRISALQCCKVWEEKADLKKEQLHCMSCLVLASQNRTCKKIIALQCCKSSEEKSDNCTALLPGVCKQNRSCLRTNALYVAGPGKHKPDMQKNNFIALLHGPG
jgi:hypothetical protein